MSKKKYETKLQVYVNEERQEEIDQIIEEGNWSSRSDYLRHVIRAGESNIAELDPRTDETRASERTEGDKEDFVTDEELVQELRRLTEKQDGDYIDVDTAIETFISELESELTDRLFRMSQDSGSAVETDKRGGYRVK
jgi:Arc/MetJ-type ribon-helix-helix transcriptional regulator